MSEFQATDRWAQPCPRTRRRPARQSHYTSRRALVVWSLALIGNASAHGGWGGDTRLEPRRFRPRFGDPFAPGRAVARDRPAAGRVVAEVRLGGKNGRASLDRGRNPRGQVGLVCQMVDDHTRRRYPKLSDGLVGVLLARIVQTDALLRGDERRGEITAEHFFLRRYRACRFRFYANGQRLPHACHAYYCTPLVGWGGRFRWRYSSHRRVASSSWPWMAWE